MEKLIAALKWTRKVHKQYDDVPEPLRFWIAMLLIMPMCFISWLPWWAWPPVLLWTMFALGSRLYYLNSNTKGDSNSEQ